MRKHIQQSVGATVIGLADVTGLTAANLDLPIQICITVRSGVLNYTLDGGTAPTASLGTQLTSTTAIPLVLNNALDIKNMRMRQDGGSTAAVIEIEIS